MATIDLGVIKPVFKGAYNNSTAYILDNIVTSGGSSYICILASTGNAVSNGTYWSTLAAGGTDVGTTLTTAGDVLYRDGSGLQRLAKGTAGQALVMNSGATAPEWGAGVSGYQMMQWERKKAGAYTTTSVSQTALVIAGSYYLTVNVKAVTDIVEVGIRMNIRHDNNSYMGYGFQRASNTAFSSGVGVQWTGGEHSIGNGGTTGDPYKFTSAVVGYTAADWGFSANTTYYIRPIGMSHSDASTFHFGNNTNNATDNGIHFYLKRWEVQ
jgi:hypothetical protein